MAHGEFHGMFLPRSFKEQRVLEIMLYHNSKYLAVSVYVLIFMIHVSFLGSYDRNFIEKFPEKF